MRGWVPLLVGALMVPASVTAFGFTVYGEELETALSSSPAVPAIPQGPVPVSDFVSPLRMKPAAPILVSAVVTQQNVGELFSSHAVKGITFAPGTSSLVGRGEDVWRGLASVLRNVAGGLGDVGVARVERRDGVATLRRARHAEAGLVRDYLAAQRVDSVITIRVIVDPVWGPTSDGGPQVDILVV